MSFKRRILLQPHASNENEGGGGGGEIKKKTPHPPAHLIKKNTKEKARRGQ